MNAAAMGARMKKTPFETRFEGPFEGPFGVPFKARFESPFKSHSHAHFESRAQAFTETSSASVHAKADSWDSLASTKNATEQTFALGPAGPGFIGQVIGSLTVMHPLRSKEARSSVAAAIRQLEGMSGSSSLGSTTTSTGEGMREKNQQHSMVVDGRIRTFPDAGTFLAAQNVVASLSAGLRDMGEPHY